jgi:hypothetical protein
MLRRLPMIQWREQRPVWSFCEVADVCVADNEREVIVGIRLKPARTRKQEDTRKPVAASRTTERWGFGPCWDITGRS